jgi:flagellar motor switch protein FliG
MDTTNPSVVSQIETVIRQKLSTVLDAESSHLRTGGVDYLVRVLRQVDRTTERSILKSLEETAPDLAEEIKKQMFVFENISMLADRSTQRVLHEIDQRDLALALRSTTGPVREHVFKNMSQRAAETVKDEIENSPPVRLRTIASWMWSAAWKMRRRSP